MHSGESESQAYFLKAQEIIKEYKSKIVKQPNARGEMVDVVPDSNLVTAKAVELKKELDSKKMSWEDLGLESDEVVDLEFMIQSWHHL